MDTLISHDTALSCLRNLAVEGRRLPRVSNPGAPPSAAMAPATAALVEDLAPGLPKLDLLVSSPEGRRNTIRQHCHVWSAPLPAGSLIEIAPAVCLSSPEFCFLQMAGRLPMPQLVQLGYELCGCYALDIRSERGFVRTEEPLTTPLSLERYLSRCENIYGHAKAVHALRWVIADSWSPMETDTAMLLTLPTRIGGYQLPPPTLNHRVSLTDEQKRRAGKSCYYLDLFWPRCTAIEFNGATDHLDRRKAGMDRTREMILRQNGVQTIVLTQYQLFRVEQFDVAVQLLCGSLGHRYRKPTPKQLQRKRTLRRALFARFGPDALIA